MADTGLLVDLTLVVMRLGVFGLALGLTLISFQAYRKRSTRRLQFAFIGFAFISMGVAMSAIVTQLGEDPDPTTLTIFRIIETVPFIIGFVMFYISLYR
jgi:hypothetical protein